MQNDVRRTRIVATIGPASESDSQLDALIAAGMNVARLNFSHGTHADHAQRIAAIRAAAVRNNQSVAILQDLQGPKIRTGALVNGQAVQLLPGATFTITTHPIIGDVNGVSTTYQHLPQDVNVGDRILISDGLLELRPLAVSSAKTKGLICRVWRSVFPPSPKKTVKIWRLAWPKESTTWPCRLCGALPTWSSSGRQLPGTGRQWG